MKWILFIIGIIIGILDVGLFIYFCVNYQVPSYAIPITIFAFLAAGLIYLGREMD